MDTQFREAAITDVEDLLRMMKEFNEGHQLLFDAARTRDSLLQFIADSGLGRIWMILGDSRTIGYIVLTFGFSFEYGGKDAFLDEIFIMKAHRNLGIGSKAVDFLVENALSFGVQAIHLEFNKGNATASSLYTKKGFDISQRVLMSKRLSKH